MHIRKHILRKPGLATYSHFDAIMWFKSIVESAERRVVSPRVVIALSEPDIALIILRTDPQRSQKRSDGKLIFLLVHLHDTQSRVRPAQPFSLRAGRRPCTSCVDDSLCYHFNNVPIALICERAGEPLCGVRLCG